MELQKNVMYVTPSGRAFTKEMIDRTVSSCENIFRNVFEIVKKVWKEFVKRVRELVSEVQKQRETKRAFCPPVKKGDRKKPIMNSQVWNRKPDFTHIRSQL